MPTIVESLKAVLACAQSELLWKRDNEQPWEFLADHVARVKDHIFDLEKGNEYVARCTEITKEQMRTVEFARGKEVLVGKYSDHNTVYSQGIKWKNRGFKPRTKKVGDNQYQLFARTR